MSHPYPPRWAAFDYRGRHFYALTFVTHARGEVFVVPDAVESVWRQILRAANETDLSVTVYCFMPDHLHLIVHGERDDSDCKRFIKAAKQYSGY